MGRPIDLLRQALVLVLAGLALQAQASDPLVASVIDTPDPVPAGGIYAYNVRVDNNGSDAAINTRLRMQVPSGATFVSASPASAACAPLAADPTTVECQLGSLGPGGSDPRDVVLRYRALGPGPATVLATASVTADNSTNPDPLNNSLRVNTTVINGSNLALGVSALPAPTVIGGANVTYTLQVSNAGPNAAGSLKIENALSPGVSYVSGGGGGWSCSAAGSLVTCTHPGPVAVGAVAPSLSIVGRVTASGGTVTNSATVSPGDVGGVPDPEPADNTATLSLNVLPGADLQMLGKQVLTPGTLTPDSNVSFLLQPRNLGPADSSNVTVSDPLPAGWTFVSASGPNWSCTQAAGTVTCTRASLPVGATDDITIVARSPNLAAVGPTGRAYTNTASIASSSTTDPIGGNNSASAIAAISPDGADLAISLGNVVSPVPLGGTVTTLVNVRSLGPRTATGPARVVVSLDRQTFVDGTGTGWVCSAVGSIVTCEHPNAGGLPPGTALPTLTLRGTATSLPGAFMTACTGGSVPTGVPGSQARPPVEGDVDAGNDCQTIAVDVTAGITDLSITSVASTPSGGDRIVSATEDSFTITNVITNAATSTSPATGIVIEDYVPGWITGRTLLDGWSRAAGTAFAPTIVVSPGSTATFGCRFDDLYRQIRCDQTGGALLPGGTVTMSYTARRPFIATSATGAGSSPNSAVVFNRAEADPNLTNNQSADSVVIVGLADVAMTGKTVTPGTVKAGEPATYVLSFINNGPSTADNVSVSDQFSFPSGTQSLTVLSIVSSKPGSTCSLAAGAVITPAASNYVCTIGSMADGETHSITLVVRPNWQAGNPVRDVDNIATISTTSAESASGGDNGNNSRSARLTVQSAQLDLLINRTDRVGALNLDPVVYTTGNTFMGYQILVTNLGPSLGTGVRITESMLPPAGKRVRFVCDVSTFGGTACNPTPLCSVTNVTSGVGTALPPFTCSLPAGSAVTGAGVGELEPGATKAIYLRYEVIDPPAPAGDVFTATATVSANEPDSQAANNQAVETTTTRQTLDIRVTKAASAASLTLLQPFNWTITVTNGGPGLMVQNNLTDTLPAEVAVTGPITWTRSSPSASGVCSLAGQTVTCNMGSLDAGASATVTIPSRVTAYPAGGNLSNTASVDVDPNVIGGVDSPGGRNVATATVPVTRSSITGLVFQDRDRTGANAGVPQAPSLEPRLAGVAVRLTGRDVYDNPVDVSATSDSNGVYTFTNLVPSNAAGYTVTQTQPVGFVNGPVAPPGSGPNAPSHGGSYAGGGSVGNSSYTGVVLPAATAAVNYNFPELRQATLSGVVYLDVNGNGQRDAAIDAGIPGATVRLLNSSTLAVLASTTTDASGAYSFTGLDPLIPYAVEQPLPTSPAQLVNGAVNPGLINGAACASGCTAQPNTPAADTDRIVAIDLSAGSDGTAFNFGERQVATISGTVYVDRNRNGALEATPTDGRLPNVTVRLVVGTDCASSPLAATALTDAQGAYAFASLAAGVTYTVCQVPAVGYAPGAINPGASAASNAANAITITNLPATGSPGNQFGWRAGSISGTVYLDANNNGLREASELGLAGVTITLSGNDITGASVTRSTVTDASGAWRFDDVLASTAAGYTVTEQAAQPTSGAVTTLNGRTTAGTTAAGAANGTATPVATLPSAVSAILLAAGADSVNHHFGELLPVSLGGVVYNDRDANGTQNLPADDGIAGVTLTLTGTDDTGAAVSRTTTTGADGSYQFSGLRPGTYAVTQPDQPAGTANGTTTAGSAGGTATAQTVLPSAISAIAVLTPGTQATGYNFGELSNLPELFVSKAALAAPWSVGRSGTYRITVRNAGNGPTSAAYTVSDRLPTGLVLSAAPTGSGWICTGAAGDSSFNCSNTTALAGGASASPISATVSIGAAAVGAAGSASVNNAVLVEGGGEIPGRAPSVTERDDFNNNVPRLPLCTTAIEHNACRLATTVQQPASLSGTVWFDGGSTPRVLDAADRRLPGWVVEVVETATGTLVGSTTSGTDGRYTITNLTAGVPLAVRFRDPASNVVFGYPVNGESAAGSSGATCNASAAGTGAASSCVGTGNSPFLSVILAPGQTLQQQSLPVDPSGVVYDSISRQAVPGAVVALEPVGSCAGWNPSTSVVGASLGGYTVSGNRIAMTVGANGLYQFLFGPSAPATCTYSLVVTPPAGYASPSVVIPPTAGPLVPTGAAGSTFLVQPQAGPPTAPAGAATAYYLSVSSGSAGANIVHNHIPLDSDIRAQLALTKSGDRAAVEVGDTMRYTITVALQQGTRPLQTTVVDTLPAGLTYIPGTATVNDVPVADPQGGFGPRLAFQLGTMPASGRLVLRYRVRVNVGAAQGDGINRARAYSCGVASSCVDSTMTPYLNAIATNEARHQVRVRGGVFTTDACVLGKVFVDCNGNHIQDPEELGIPGVRLLLSDGSFLISDSEGKYSLCGLPPRSHVLKVDPLTLPRGSRLATSSNRNLGDAGSLWLDLKVGELHRADFIEGSCSNTVLEQVKARRAQGEVRAPETEKRGGPALRFDSKAHGRGTLSSPQQGTDTANQRTPKPRTPQPAPRGTVEDESNLPTPILPMNNAPAAGSSGATTQGGSNAGR